MIPLSERQCWRDEITTDPDGQTDDDRKILTLLTALSHAEALCTKLAEAGRRQHCHHGEFEGDQRYEPHPGWRCWAGDKTCDCGADQHNQHIDQLMKEQP